MAQSINIDLSVAANVSFCGLKDGETTTVTFRPKGADILSGTFRFTVWNSPQKNSVIVEPVTLPVENNTIVCEINTVAMALVAGNHYYEIGHVESTRTIMEGDLKIKK